MAPAQLSVPPKSPLYGWSKVEEDSSIDIEKGCAGAPTQYPFALSIAIALTAGRVLLKLFPSTGVCLMQSPDPKLSFDGPFMKFQRRPDDLEINY